MFHVRACYQAERRYVLALILRAGVPHADAEDLLHEVFCILLECISRLDQPESLRGWLAAVTRFVCKNYRRNSWRRARWLDACSIAVAKIDAAAEDRYFITQVVASLDERYREVWLQSALDATCARELAEQMQVSPNTVSSRLRLARRDIRVRMLRSQANLC